MTLHFSLGTYNLPCNEDISLLVFNIPAANVENDTGKTVVQTSACIMVHVIYHGSLQDFCRRFSN